MGLYHRTCHINAEGFQLHHPRVLVPREAESLQQLTSPHRGRSPRHSPALSLCQHWCWSSSASMEQFSSLILQKTLSFSARLAPWRRFIQLAHAVWWKSSFGVTVLLSLLFVYGCIEAGVFKRPARVKCLCLLENLSHFSKPR